MSYCRWTPDSDVYVYEASRHGFVCCMCSIDDRDDVHTETRSGMVEHLAKHEAAGERVPAYAAERLRAEIETIGEFPRPREA